jgi:hypothetical protein
VPVVQSTIQHPDGTGYANVPVTIELVGTLGGPVVGYVTATDTEISGPVQLVTNASGTWSVTLTGNAAITPSGTVYRVHKAVPDDPDPDQYVTVPTSGGPYAVADILTDPPGALTPSALAAHITDPSAHGGGGTGTGNPMGTVVSETSYGQSPAVGASGNFSRGDHSHGTPAGGVATTVVAMNAFDLASVVGTASTFAREDHRHSTPATPAGGVTLGSSVAAETSYGISSNAGAASTASKSDHTHGSPAKPLVCVATFQFKGALTVGAGTQRSPVPFACTVAYVIVTLTTPSSSGSVKFDLNYSATLEGAAATLYSTQANRPTVTANTHGVAATLPDTTSLAANSYLTCDADEIGTAPAGAVLCVFATVP